MSFSSDWLRLREPVDHRSRNAALAEKLAAHFRGRQDATVYDLGAGLGSNLRGTYRHLPARQYWRLVDNDPGLLAAAAGEISDWADSARPTASGVEAQKDGFSLHVEVKRHDLAADPAPWGSQSPDLVTAAALFDLVSVEWIGRFVQAVAASKAGFYTVLTHDARSEWSPAHPADAVMKAAFEIHFGRDKGFGPSSGGEASRLMAEAFADAGYQVERGPSPWMLGGADSALIAELARGWAGAVRETGRVPESTIAEWTAARASANAGCVIGHEDLLALPRV